MWKEAVMAQFQALSHYLQGVTKKNHTYSHTHTVTTGGLWA
jgi:hypothetical protein